MLDRAAGAARDARAPGVAHHSPSPAGRLRRRQILLFALIGILALNVPAYVLVPASDPVRAIWYDVIAAVALAVGFAGLRRHRPQRRRGWVLVLPGSRAGSSATSSGRSSSRCCRLVYPVPSDAVYLSSYVLLGAGALVFARSRRGRDLRRCSTPRSSRPAPASSSRSSSSRRWPPTPDCRRPATPSARPTRWATCSCSASSPGSAPRPAARTRVVPPAGGVGRRHAGDATWLERHLALAGDSACPSAWSRRRLAHRLPARRRRRLRAVDARAGRAGAGPPRAHAVPRPARGAHRRAHAARRRPAGRRRRPAAACGGRSSAPARCVLSVLVLLRMVGLVHVVQAQAVRLAALASSDSLTGAPNRRTWDHELSRACQVEPRARHRAERRRPRPRPLQGLQRRRTATRPATGCCARPSPRGPTRCRPGTLLARYGGEEFAVLFPATGPEAAAAVAGAAAGA